MTATTDQRILMLVQEEVSFACRTLFGDAFADAAVRLWEATPSFDQLNDAAKALIVAANRVAPEGHHAPE